MPIAEGKQFNFKDITSIRSDFLEVVEFNSAMQVINIETNEFSAVCPFSGLPDIANVVINYVPTGNKIIELKSLKYYFVSFREVGIYQEAVTKKICEDLHAVLNCQIEVVTKYNTRGGFDVVCTEKRG